MPRIREYPGEPGYPPRALFRGTLRGTGV